jgi:hypothetical protein
VTLGGRRFLFAGDGIWHDGTGWKSFPTKPGRTKMIDGLRRLAEVEFDVPPANTRVNDPMCSVEVDAEARRAPIVSVLEQLSPSNGAADPGQGPSPPARYACAV